MVSYDIHKMFAQREDRAQHKKAGGTRWPINPLLSHYLEIKKELFNLEKSMVRDAHHKVIYLPHGKRAT